MTETSTTVTQFPISQRIGTLGSAGQLMPGTLARVVKQDGSLAGYDEEGELHVYGPQMALCYTNNAEAYVQIYLHFAFCSEWTLGLGRTRLIMLMC